MSKKVLGSICYIVLLLGFTTYVILDTFVLQDVYVENVSDKVTEQISNNTQVQESMNETNNTTTEQIDNDAQIQVSTYEAYNTTIYVADVQFSSIQSIQTAFANDTYGRNVTEYTSTMAENNQARLAINGDYYGAQESGYVIRNGIVYRDSANDKDVCCIYNDGTMKIVSAYEKTAQELVDEGVWQAFTFGPGLVEDGEISVTENEEVGKARSSNPRTAIGMIDTYHYVFVVSDGRTEESEGLSLYELATFMQELGVTCAYNLDGGGSSTMVVDGVIINNPTTNGKISERKVSDIVYVQ